MAEQSTMQNALNRSVNKNQLAMQRINILASNETNSVLTAGLDMSFNEQASFVRTVFPTIVDKYGNVSSLSGMQHYNEMRALRNITDSFEATIPVLDYTETINSFMGYAISENYNKGYESMAKLLVDEVTLYVSNYNRDTVDFNAKKDKKVISVQRVAERNACAFCLTVALNQYTFAVGGDSGKSISDYDKNYHSHCHCSVEAVYEGEDPIYPSYYDNFQTIYDSARENVTTGAKETFAEIRKITGRG